jgi:nucleoid DNA-binding protein
MLLNGDELWASRISGFAERAGIRAGAAWFAHRRASKFTNRSLQNPHGTGLMRTHMGTLTKRELVVTISNETGLVQHQVFDVVQRTLDHLTDALAKGDTVELRNFGVFEVRLTKARVGRNPNKPGSSFVIPPRATVKFKSGKIMRQKVSKLSAEMKRAQQDD